METTRGFNPLDSTEKKIKEVDGRIHFKKFFNEGDLITVQRTNGEIEDGWKITTINETNTVFVVKTDKKNGKMIKRVSFKEILELNQEKKCFKEFFNEGDLITVQRTNGEIEDGWKITTINRDGTVFVTKTDKKNGKMIKKVSFKKILEFNQEVLNQ